MKSMQIIGATGLVAAALFFTFHALQAKSHVLLQKEMGDWLARRKVTSARCVEEYTIEGVRACMKANDNAEASRLAQVISSRDATHSLEATALLGELAWYGGHLDQARATFKQVASAASGEVAASALLSLAALEEEVGDMEAGRRAVERAAEKAQTTLTTTGVATQLATIFHDQGDLAEARDLLTPNALSTTAARLGELAAVHYDMADMKLAADVFCTALSLDTDSEMDRIFQNAALVLAASGNNHGVGLLKEFADVQQAEIRTALAGGVKPTHRYNTLGYTYLRMSALVRPNDATTALNYAFMAERSFMTSGITTPDLAESYNILGNANADLKDFEAAEMYLTKALEIFESSVGLRSTKAAAVMVNIATVVQERGGDATRIEDLYLRAGHIQTVLHAPNDAAGSWQNLAVLYYQEGRVLDAHDMSRRAVETAQEAGLPEENPDLQLYIETFKQIEQVIEAARNLKHGQGAATQ